MITCMRGGSVIVREERKIMPVLCLAWRKKRRTHCFSHASSKTLIERRRRGGCLSLGEEEERGGGLCCLLST